MGTIPDGHDGLDAADSPHVAGGLAMPQPVIATLPLATRHGGRLVGTFTLTPISPRYDGHHAYLISCDAAATAYFTGSSTYADRTIGCLTRTKRGWSAAAYLDREEFLQKGGVGAFLPDVESLRHGARVLLRWWWLHGHPSRSVAELSDAVCRGL